MMLGEKRNNLFTFVAAAAQLSYLFCFIPGVIPFFEQEKTFYGMPGQRTAAIIIIIIIIPLKSYTKQV